MLWAGQPQLARPATEISGRKRGRGRWHLATHLEWKATREDDDDDDDGEYEKGQIASFMDWPSVRPSVRGRDPLEGLMMKT